MTNDPLADPQNRCPDCLRVMRFPSWTVPHVPDEGSCLACPACHYAVLRFLPRVAKQARIPERIVFRPGIYQHYKGRFYRVHFIGFEGVTPEDPISYHVWYEPLYELPAGQPLLGSRAIADFFSPGDTGGERFVYVGPMPPDSTTFDKETGAPIAA